MRIFILSLLLMSAALSMAESASQVDPNQEKGAQAIVRAKLISRDPNQDKYANFEVEVLKVIRNQSKERIGKRLTVWDYGWKVGVPKGESTLYIEYNTYSKSWYLISGPLSTDKSGVSHTKE
jgi:hypothetical protein